VVRCYSAGVRCRILPRTFRKPPRVSLLSSTVHPHSAPPTMHFRFRYIQSLFPFQCVLFRAAVCARAFICCNFEPSNMVHNLVRITSDYEARLAACPYVLNFSYGRRMLRKNGDPNRLFLAYLFCDASNAIQYLKDIGLFRSTMKCNSCGRDMSWSADRTVNDKFRWRCHKSVAGNRC